MRTRRSPTPTDTLTRIPHSAAQWCRVTTHAYSSTKGRCGGLTPLEQATGLDQRRIQPPRHTRVIARAHRRIQRPVPGHRRTQRHRHPPPVDPIELARVCKYTVILPRVRVLPRDVAPTVVHERLKDH